MKDFFYTHLLKKKRTIWNEVGDAFGKLVLLHERTPAWCRVKKEASYRVFKSRVELLFFSLKEKK